MGLPLRSVGLWLAIGVSRFLSDSPFCLGLLGPVLGPIGHCEAVICWVRWWVEGWVERGGDVLLCFGMIELGLCCSGKIHHPVIGPLEHDTVYFYRCGGQGS
uniref:Secreted protein n=1 Tax=Quercus lobata TaxID=97700 RepID=A0A7N2M931_QUELO